MIAITSELDKMRAGQLYDPQDRALSLARQQARDLCHDLNATREHEKIVRRKLLKTLLGQGGKTVWIQPSFYCDYGSNIHLGKHCYFNFNCVVLDVCSVTVGGHTLFGPAVQIYTAMHPMAPGLRREREFGQPVSIGQDVWVGGGAIICPGVSIGDRTIIGAGSVVTRDVPAEVFAAGNPCRVVRPLTADELAN